MSLDFELTGMPGRIQNSAGVIQLRHLIQSWHDLVRRVKEATEMLLFLDYEATSTRTVAHVEMAVLSSHGRSILRQR